jgi:hypothetical protein
MAQFIKNKKGDNLVIDIRGGGCKPVRSGTSLDAFSKKTTDNCNQLWTLTPPGPEGFSFIRSKQMLGKHHFVISIRHGDTPPGSPLDVFEELSGSGKDSQLWTLV